MDIFQRVCCKEGVVIPKDDESEVLTVCSCEEEMCEEECYIPQDEPIDPRMIEAELECMKRRIQVLQLKLKKDFLEPCPDEPCVDFEVELTCSENKEICQLQKNQHKLQCQINELVECCKCAKEQIADLRMRMCEKSREILQLQKLVGELISWRNTLDHEFGVCIERFEYLKHVKAEWKDVQECLDKYQRCQLEKNKTFVLKNSLVTQRNEFINEITEVRQLICELINFMLERVNNADPSNFGLNSVANLIKLAPNSPLKGFFKQPSVIEKDVSAKPVPQSPPARQSVLIDPRLSLGDEVAWDS